LCLAGVWIDGSVKVLLCERHLIYWGLIFGKVVFVGKGILLKRRRSKLNGTRVYHLPLCVVFMAAGDSFLTQIRLLGCSSGHQLRLSLVSPHRLILTHCAIRLHYFLSVGEIVVLLQKARVKLLLIKFCNSGLVCTCVRLLLAFLGCCQVLRHNLSMWGDTRTELAETSIFLRVTDEKVLLLLV